MNVDGEVAPRSAKPAVSRSGICWLAGALSLLMIARCSRAGCGVVYRERRRKAARSVVLRSRRSEAKLGGDRHRPCLPALASTDRHPLLLEVDVTGIQGSQFRSSH